MKPSILQLEEYSITECSLKSASKFNNSANFANTISKLEMNGVQFQQGFLLNFDLNHPDIIENADIDDDELNDKYAFIARLTIEIKKGKNKNFPYTGKIGAEGFFTIQKLKDKNYNELEKISAVNSASLLYGIIREQFLSLSLKFAHGKILLPAITFSPDELLHNEE